MFLFASGLLGLLSAWVWYVDRENFDPASIVVFSLPFVATGLIVSSLNPILKDVCLRAAELDWDEAGSCQTNPDSVSRRWRLLGFLCPLRLTAAAHPRTLRLRLAGLLYSPVPQVAVAAASNPSTPAFAIILARRQKRLRKVFLTLPGTPTSTLHSYAKAPDVTEIDLLSIARHPNADCEVLKAVIANFDEEDERWTRWHPMDIYETIARHPKAGQENLHSLATNVPERFDKSQLVRIQQAVARNEAASPETLTWLAENSKDYTVLKEVAQNPSTPEPSAVLAALRSEQQGTFSTAGLPSWARRLNSPSQAGKMGRGSL